MNGGGLEEPIQLTKSGTVRKRKPKQPIQYFTQETENAILEYLASTDTVHRNKVFNEKIDYAFYKLVENIIHTFKFYYTEGVSIEELKHEVVSVLLEKLHLYSQEKGKAYSYFGTIAKRYLINYNKKNYKKQKEKAALEEVDADKSILVDIANRVSKQQDLESLNVVDIFILHVEENTATYFTKERDVKIVDAVLEIFKKRENLDILSKKALYIYIREITDAPTPVITTVIKKLKKLYKIVLDRYLEAGYRSNIY